MVDEYAESQKSAIGTIGSHVFIRNTRYLCDVRIGDHAVISGVNRLRNGSVNSNEAAPVTISHGVIMDDFIVSSGSYITDNTSMSRCFVGQACHFGHSYSASDSLFFSNCQGENGEACAIFAGPFTVTHHKSTLLIAGNFSFMNAGSGSNQSNHMYKLGPIHQGILERGAKTSSDSYILWPSRVGAFSLVMGRHVTHSDTTLNVKAETLMALNGPVMNLIVNACIIALSWFGAHFIVEGSLTTGQLTSLFSYIMTVLSSLMMLSMIFVQLTQSAASGARIAEVICEEPDMDNPMEPVMQVPDGRIDFNHVYFSYKQGGDYALEDIEGGPGGTVQHRVEADALPGTHTA